MRYHITLHYTLVAYPEANEQVKAINKQIINRIKALVDRLTDKYADEFPSILWGYNTT